MDRLKLIWQRSNRWHRVLFVFILVELQIIPKRQLGFECNDPKLSHSFKGDTITLRWLLTSVIFLPLIVLLITERIYYNQDKRSKDQALCWYKEYLYGLLINLTVVQTLKILVGAPRPHFFDTCNSKEASACTGNEYVYSYTCTKSHWMNYPDTSFPSGHASLGIYTGFFIAYYLHKRTKHFRSTIIFPIQIVFVVMGIFCALSRITDKRHHWWDVMAGAVIGVIILVYTIFSLCKNFACPIITQNSKQNETALTADENQHSEIIINN